MNAIWNRLKDFRVSEGNEELTFVARLARETEWTIEYAERVFQEYLKFIYLASIAEAPMTPSEDVDQAWHLHLCYSHSYWNELCGQRLGKELHHGPTQGGRVENEKYWRQYENTLHLYEEHFGGKPPEDIWPPVKIRFDRSNRFVRVNLKEAFVIRKKPLYILSSLGLGALLLTGCADVIKQAWEGDPFTVIVIGVAVAFGLWILLKLLKGGGGGGGSSGWFGCGFGGGGCGSSCGSGCGGGCGGA